MPPPAAPDVTRPQDAIPADLDVVVRFDMARMRDALGPAARWDWRRHVPQGLPGIGPGDPLLSDALARADTVWLALRPGLSPELTDNVMVLEGRFADVDPPGYKCQPRWSAPADLGGGWRVSERPTPEKRSGPARVYMRHDELLVFASVAELDSVERAVEVGARDPHLEPPSEGVVSVEARGSAVALLAREQAPAAARLLRRISALRAHADLSTRGLDAELELQFETPSAARAAAPVLSRLLRETAALDAQLRILAEAIEVAAIGKVVVLRVRVSREALSRIVACAQGSSRDCAAPADESTAGQPGESEVQD